MCRLAAYLGPEISLGEFIISEPHSLYKQSWQPKEMQDAVLNADGFGFAWYENNKPQHYRNTVPIWSDQNLQHLAGTLKQNHWLACVRSATPGQGSGIDNTQPFIHDNIAMMHNGFISNFNNIKPQLIEVLQTKYLSLIKGNTDSEYLFALWLQHYANSTSLLESMTQLSEQIKQVCNSTSAMFNIVISNGDTICALKDAINMQTPSLYFIELNNDNKQQIIIASEPFNEQSWQAVPDHSILLATETDGCQIHPLS